MTAEQPTGELSLRIERRRDANGGDGSSVATSQFHRGALRVLRPYYADDSGQATYTVINPGGAYFGGDTYQLTLDVADNAALRVTTQSATKVYKTPQGPAHQTMHITLGESARLDYVPDQLIVYENGSYRQDTTVDMFQPDHVGDHHSRLVTIRGDIHLHGTADAHGNQGVFGAIRD